MLGPFPKLKLPPLSWPQPISFTSAARGLVVGLGAVAAVMGMMGLTATMATNLAAAGLVVWPAVLAGLILFGGGLGVIAWVWRAQMVCTALLETNPLYVGTRIAREQTPTTHQPPRPSGKPELKPVS